MMNEIIVREFTQLDYDYIVYPTTYINPLAKLNLLNEQLRTVVGRPCELLFDLLLCNGDNFNRFAKVAFDGEKIERASMEVVEDLSTEVVSMIELYYKEDVTSLKKGVLVPGEYLLHC